MRAFLYNLLLQWKLDMRNKTILLTYYVFPLLFFCFMSSIVVSIDPASKLTLIQTLTLMGVTMGALLGAPTTLTTLYTSEIKKAYKVGGIPLWAGAINNFLSAFINLLAMSVIIFAIAPLVFDATLPQNVGMYFLSLAFFIVSILSVGTVLGLFIKKPSKLTIASQLVFLPSLMLSGIMFPTDILPTFLQYLGLIFPTSWGYKILTQHPTFLLFLPLMGVLLLMVFLSVLRMRTIARE